MPTREIFNAKTQEVEEAELSVDQNNEIVATFTDGEFVKFPAGLTQDTFAELIQAHEDSSKGQIVLTPEYEAAQVAERAASESLIGLEPTTNPGNTMPEGDQTNVPTVDAPA